MSAANGYFYSERQQRTVASARAIVPIAMRLVKPASVIDVGCGIGTWLAEFQEQGVERVRGLDGDYVELSYLQIADPDFIACDLTKPPTQGHDWDLAISLEVAEHLPPESAQDFIEYLCGLAPAILFSAAIPGQGGFQHLNEQWPQFWASLFDRNSYMPFDVIRWQVWDNSDVLSWYAQNTLLFVKKGSIHEAICNEETSSVGHSFNRQSCPISVVHPHTFKRRLDPLTRQVERPSMREAAKRLAEAVARRARNTLTRQ